MKDRKYKSGTNFKERFSHRSMKERYGRLFLRLKTAEIYRKPDFWFRTLFFLFVAFKMTQLSLYTSKKAIYLDKQEAIDANLYFSPTNPIHHNASAALDYLDKSKNTSNV